MALPYPPNFDGYERANGEFEYQGEYYRIAKYRHINDTLLVVMVKNKRETSLHQSITHFVQASNDVPSSASSIKLMVSFAKEFISNSSHLLVGSVGWCASLALVDFEKKTISPYSHLIHPPPPKHRLQHTLQLPHTKSWWL